jgi:hypothetical protein
MHGGMHGSRVADAVHLHDGSHSGGSGGSPGCWHHSRGIGNSSAPMQRPQLLQQQHSTRLAQLEQLVLQSQ